MKFLNNPLVPLWLYLAGCVLFLIGTIISIYQANQMTPYSARIVDCPLDRKTPFAISGVSNSQLSIARHYGGIKVNGERYTYIPPTDELVRDDVLKWLNKKKAK